MQSAAKINKTVRRSDILMAAFALLTVFFFSYKALATVQVASSHQGDATHLEFTGENQWDYDVKKIEDKQKQLVQITVPALDQASLSKIKTYSSPLLKVVNVNTQGADGKTVLTLQLLNKQIEPFDYLTEKPSRLIVDFYLKKQTVEEKKSNKNKKQIANSNSAEDTADEELAVEEKEPGAQLAKVSDKLSEQSLGLTKRRPAEADTLKIGSQGPLAQITTNPNSAMKSGNGSQGEWAKVIPNFYDAGDSNYERFSIKDYEIKEKTQVAAKNNVYIEFPMLRMDLPYLETLQIQQPIYEIASNETEENKQARLLKTLFDKKRYNVFLKTLDWFLQKYPESPYDEIVRFMWADTLYAMWNESRRAEDFDLAMLRYRQVLEKYPKSPLVERTMLLMGLSSLDRGDYLGTLRLLQAHIQQRPQSPNKEIAQFAIAEAYLKISRFEETKAIYTEIENNSTSEKSRVRAAYRRGDASFQQKKYGEAIAEYQRVLQKYPKFEEEYPNAYYNQASALFSNGEYKKSLEMYREFLKRYPTRTESGYAMTRIGEILEILGADATRVTGVYQETVFRFGETPSSIVARLRLLAERMGGMRPKDLEKAVKDITEIAGKSDLPKMQQFATIIISDGYNQRKEFDKSIDLLVKYYQQNPTTVDTKLFEKRVIKNINDQLKNLIAENKYIDALKIHNKYIDNWLKNTDRVDIKYEIGVAFEQLGAFKQAEKYYQDSLNKIYTLRGTKEGNELKILDQIPGDEVLNLRMAQVQNQLGQFSRSYENLKNIKNPESLTERDQIERIQLAASLMEKRGEIESAARYLTELLKTWSGIPQLVADPYYQLAQIEIKQNKKKEAITSLKKIDELMADSQKVAPYIHEKSLQQLAELYEQTGQRDQQVETLNQLLQTYEKAKPLSSWRYKLGMLYFEKGEMQKASEIWNELKNDKNDFWYKLSQEQLKGSEWKNDYKKYIKRIPAMAEPAASTAPTGGNK